MRSAVAAAAIGVAAALCAVRVATAATDSCVHCHERDDDDEVSAAVPEWRASVHFRAEVTCDGCHGGDPHAKDEDAAHDEDAGWVGTPAWNDVAGFCGSCHESIAHAYSEGAFGADFAGGVPPTCVDCHMATGHDTKPAHPDEILPDPLPAKWSALPQLASARRDGIALGAREAEVATRVREVGRLPLPPSGLERELRDAHDAWVPQFHRFAPEAFVPANVAARASLATVERRALDLDHEARSRMRLGAAGLGILVLTLAGLGALRARSTH